MIKKLHTKETLAKYFKGTNDSKRMREKRGISPIILMVLTVLFVLGAIAIIARELLPFVGKLNSGEQPQDCLTLALRPTSCIYNSTLVSVQVARRDGKGSLSKMKFLFDTSQGRYVITVPATLRELESRTFSFGRGAVPTDPEKFDIAPMINAQTACSPTGTVIQCVSGVPPADSQETSSNSSVCSNGLDDDHDGWIDFDGLGNVNRADPGCSDVTDDSEINAPLSQCADSIDNDNDTRIDGSDTECVNWQGINESLQGTPSFACSNTIDDDTDGLVDWPFDPGCSDPDDDSETDNSARLPLLALEWTQPTATHYDFLVPFVGINISLMSESDLSNLDTMYYEYRPSTIARNLKDVRQRYGISVLYDWTFGSNSNGQESGYGKQPISSNPGDYCQGTTVPCLWWDNGIANVSRRYQIYFTALMQQLAQQNTQLDVLLLDFESYLSEYELGRDMNNPATAERWQAIQNDSRLTTDQRYGGSVVSQLGIPDTNIIARIRNQPQTGGAWQRWDGVMYKRVAAMATEAVQPVRALSPATQISGYNYQEHGDALAGSRFFAPNIWFPHVRNYGVGASLGTHQAPSIYPYENTVSPAYITQAGTGNDAFDVRPYPYNDFNLLRYTQNKARASKLGSSTPLHFWIHNKGYSIQQNTAFTNEYYEEWIIHSALINPAFLLYWNPTPSYSDADSIELDAILREFNNIAGFADKQTLVSANGDAMRQSMIPWDADFVLTGINAGNRKIWRFTPDPAAIGNQPAVAAIISQLGNTVVLQTARSTITITNAKVYNPDNAVSSKGLWIVQTGPSNPSIVNR